MDMKNIESDSVTFNFKVGKKNLEVAVWLNEKGLTRYSVEEIFKQCIWGEDRNKNLGDNKVHIYTCHRRRMRVNKKLKSILEPIARVFFNTKLD